MIAIKLIVDNCIKSIFRYNKTKKQIE